MTDPTLTPPTNYHLDEAARVFDVTVGVTRLYPEDDEWIARYLTLNTKHWISAAQTGGRTRKPHYQIRLQTARQETAVHIQRAFEQELTQHLKSSITHIYCEPTRDERSRRDIYRYASDIRTLARGYRVRSDMDGSLGADLKNSNPDWRHWQVQLSHLLDNLDARKILYVFDPVGGVGKTYWAKWRKIWSQTQYFTQLDPNQLQQGLQNLYVTGRLPHSVVIDLPRAIQNQPLLIAKYLGVAETASNGVLQDSRHEWKEAIMSGLHTCIIANYLPNPRNLSADRWMIVRPDYRPDQGYDRLCMVDVYAGWPLQRELDAVMTARVPTGESKRAEYYARMENLRIQYDELGFDHPLE